MNADQRFDEERLEEALFNLLRRIHAGEEYPDASWIVSFIFNVPYEKLQEAYDNHKD